MTVQPRLLSNGTQVTLRMASGGIRAPYRFGGVDYRSGVFDLPRFSSSFGWDEGGWNGAARPQFAAVRWSPSLRADLKNYASLYMWREAVLTADIGDEVDTVVSGIVTDGGTEPASWTPILAGIVKEIAVSEAALVLTVADNAALLDKPIVTGHFAGTGGVEGPAEAEGREKRRSYGYVFNVEGRIIDKVNNIWEFGDPAVQLQSIVEVRDLGRAASPTPTSVAWAGSVAATFTALQAATAVQGSCVIAPSIGCVKWWTQPAGPLTADLIGSGDYGNTAVALTKHIANELAVTMSTTPATVSAMMANTANAGVHIGDDRMTAANAIDRLLLGAGVFWRFAPAGTLDLLPIDIANPVETVLAPSIERLRIFPPHRNRRLGYKRNERPMSDGEIAALVLSGDIGDFGNYIVSPDDNQLRNDLFDTYYWTYSGTSGGAPVQASGLKGTTYAEDAWRPLVLEVPLGGSQLKKATSGKIPVIPGRWYWSIVRVARSTGATAGGGSVSIDGNFRDSGGSSLLQQTTSLAIGSIPNGAYTQLVVAQQAPATAATLDFIASVTSNTGTGTVRFDGPILTDIEPAADVTMSVGYGPSADSIKYDYLGAALAGELSQDLVYKLNTAAGVYTGTVTWKYKVLLGTVNGHASGTTEYTDTIAGTSGVGTFTLNSLGANDNQVEIAAYVNGRRRATVLTLTKDIQPAPATGGGSGGGSSSQSSGFSSFSGTTFVAVTSDLLYTTPTGQTTITVSSTLQASPAGLTGTGNWNIEAKVQRETSPGTWADVGSLITGASSQSTDGEGGPLKTGADMTASRQATGLTASTQYKFRIVMRINSTGSTNTTRSHNVTGTVNAISP